MLDCYCSEKSAMLMHRFSSVVLGMTVLILTAHSYSTLFSEEVFFCTIVIITFSISFILLIAHLLYTISDDNLRVKYFDTWFHVLGCPVVLISGMFMLSAALDRPDPLESMNNERVLAACFGMINGLNYGFIGFLTYKKLPSLKRINFGEGLEWEDPLVQSQESKKSGFGSI